MILKREFISACKIIKVYMSQLDELAAIFPMHEDFKARRKELFLSMDDVSKATGIPKSTISRLENGKEVFYSSVKAIYDYYLKQKNE